MRSTQEYFSSFFNGLGSLLKGMSITLREFFTPKTTEKYPENRATLKMFDRFRGELTMPHNERNEHHCVACGAELSPSGHYFYPDLRTRRFYP